MLFEKRLLGLLLMLTLSVFAAESANIFVQDPAVFHQRQADLEKLKSSLGSDNAELDSLLANANRIAKINDQCASVRINDVMGDECWTFYQVELPAFEERYMRVTGEVHLGHMEIARGLDDRKLQIEACTEALYSLAASKDQFLSLEGGIFLEPLDQGFEANYNFTLMYEPNHRSRAFEIAQKWGETCREMVIRQDESSFAPYFVSQLEKLNEKLAENGSLAVFKMDSSSLTIYLDNARPLRCAYYLNFEKLFHSRINSGKAEESNLRISFKNGGVAVDGNETVVKFDGTPATYKGTVHYAGSEKSMNGRWFWENQGNTEGVDFGPDYDADSLVAEKAAETEKQKIADSAAAEKRKGFHPSLWVGLTGVVAPYANEAAKGYGLKEDDLFILPDVAAAIRVKLGFGENGEGSVALGVGGMLGFAYGDELEKFYIAPLAQFELGYKMFGFRETAIFPIAGDDEEQWLQFRSGLFVSLGMFNVELGHALVTNVGNGGYISFGLVF